MSAAQKILVMAMCAALAGPIVAQDREWSRAGALRAYEKAKDRDDSRRGWIVDVLGRFDGAEIEDVLLSELKRAVLPSLRRRVVVALVLLPSPLPRPPQINFHCSFVQLSECTSTKIRFPVHTFNP